MHTLNSVNNTILLFFKSYETDKLFYGDRYLKRLVRPLYDLLHTKRKITGFEMSFKLLKTALEQSGYQVRVNDYAYARRHPEHPVGLLGGPQIMQDWTLPNPAILGPSLYDHPGQAPLLMQDPRFKLYVCLAHWMYELFETVYSGKCIEWFAGIDTNQWPDLSTHVKTTDFLIYDKFLWDHEHKSESLLMPIIDRLKALGMSYRLIRYKHHDHATYRAGLSQSRGMLFLADHETQGLAYQEALAANIPILAWDLGLWTDPLYKRFSQTPPKASSVPFFSTICGEKFSGLEDFESALTRFIAQREKYRPRQFIETEMSFSKSANIYANAYFSLAKSHMKPWAA